MEAATQTALQGRSRTIKPMLSFTEVLELLQRQGKSLAGFIRPIGASPDDFNRAAAMLQGKAS